MMQTVTDHETELIREIMRCRKWIEAALAFSGGTHEFEDIAKGIAAGQMQLWPNKDACAVTEIVIYPRKKVLHVFLAGGDMDQIIEMQDDAAKWGRRQGCTGITLAGRQGWKKVLKQSGWEPQFLTLAKEV